MSQIEILENGSKSSQHKKILNRVVIQMFFYEIHLAR